MVIVPPSSRPYSTSWSRSCQENAPWKVKIGRLHMNVMNTTCIWWQNRLAKAFLTCVIWMVSSTGSSDRLRPVSTQIIWLDFTVPNLREIDSWPFPSRLHYSAVQPITSKLYVSNVPKKNRIIRIPKIFSQHIQGLTCLTVSCKSSLKSIHWNQSNPLKNQHLSRP